MKTELKTLNELAEVFGPNTPMDYVGDLWGSESCKLTPAEAITLHREQNWTDDGYQLLLGAEPGTPVLVDAAGNAILRLCEPEPITVSFYGIGREKLAGVHPHERCAEAETFASREEAEARAKSLMELWSDCSGVKYREAGGEWEYLYREDSEGESDSLIRDWVAQYGDDDEIPDDELVANFRLLYGRDPDATDREQGLWSLIWRAR